MQNNLSLCMLVEGESATVTGLHHSTDMNRRFRDIGLIEGTSVKCLQKSPWGTPIAYLIRGAVIALRAKDCEKISIKLT